jgi:polysaccharide export outer membrane protein
MKNRFYFGVFLSLIFLSSCKMYKSNIILKAEEKDINWSELYQKAIIEHPITIGDRIQFSVFTNLGESIIDPSGQLIKVGADNNNATQIGYEVLENGTCYFPVLGKLSVFGLKASQLDSLLSIKYEKLYNDVVVISKVINRKIVVYNGDKASIVPYTTNMNILELIALSGGLSNDVKGYNIRVVRGDLSKPEITIVNLKTINEMKTSIVSLKPNDIIYIEPVRKPFSEGIRDNLFILNLGQVVLTFIVLINSLK